MGKDENVKKYPETIDTRVALLEVAISHINETLVRLENKIDKQFDEVKLDIKEVTKDVKFDFIFVIGAICGLAAIMAHGFHWF